MRTPVRCRHERFRFLAALAAGVFLAAPALAQTAPAPRDAPSLKWGAHLDLEGKIGNERRLGEGDLFVPLLQDGKSMFFANIKARMDDSASSEGNFGVGVRHMLDAGFNLGAYGFLDRRRTEHANYFNQVTLGAEALSTNWDLRANAYLPEGRRSHPVDSFNTATLEGTSVVFRGGEERSLTGFDGEIGYRVPVFKAEEDRQWRVFAGAYRFYGDGINSVQGPRLRTELTFDEIPWLWQGSRMTWGGEFQDDIRGKTGFVTARLRIPLQVFGEGRKVASLTSLERRMTDPIVRDIDIVSRSGTFGAPETATQNANGRTLTVLSGGTTPGAQLSTALATAGANSTVILTSSFNIGTNFLTLQPGQTLMGAGTLTVRTPSGRTARLTLASGATVNAARTGAAIEASNNSTVTGLTINNTDGTLASGIMVDSVAGVTVSNNTITVRNVGPNNGAFGVIVFQGGSATITDNTLSSQSSSDVNAAIYIHSGTATIARNTLSATGFHPRYLNLNSGQTVTINSAASTGNTALSGTCDNQGSPTGFVSFTNAAICGTP